MNPVYLMTYRRYRRLFLLVIALAVAASAWLTLGQPKLYRASATLWADTPGSTQEAYGAPPPAAQEQSLLNELLTTHQFRESVARRGPLLRHLEHDVGSGWGPGALLAKLRGPAALEDRLATELGPGRVTSAVLGPHVLMIRFDGQSPALAFRTLRALVSEFEGQRTALRSDSVAWYRDEAQVASAALTRARKTIAEYRRDHPKVMKSPELRALAQIERQATQRLAAATEQLSRAAVARADPAAFQPTLRVLDPPQLPTAATTGRKQLVLAVFAGLFAGLLLSGLGIVAFAAGVELLRRTQQPAPAQTNAAEGAAPDPPGGRPPLQTLAASPRDAASAVSADAFDRLSRVADALPERGGGSR